MVCNYMSICDVMFTLYRRVMMFKHELISKWHHTFLEVFFAQAQTTPPPVARICLKGLQFEAPLNGFTADMLGL